MKKKKLFDANLYLEGLHQLKPFAIITMIILVIIAIAIPTGTYLEEKSRFLIIDTNSDVISTYSPIIVPVLKYHFYYIGFFLLVTPTMVFVLFRFLTKRDCCDFYHAIPHTKNCLFFSFSAAIFSCIFAEILVTSAISAIFYQLFSKYIQTDISKIFILGGNTFIVCILLASAMMLAFSISGNIITTVMTFLMVMFLPRIFLAVLNELSLYNIPYLSGIINPFPIRNLLFYDFFLEMNAYHDYELANACTITFGFASLYTVIIALILYFAAAFFFSHRKSEVAENSMASRKLQNIFRTVFTMLICLIPITLIVAQYAEKDIYYDNSYYDTQTFIFFVIISYLAAMIGMFLYEFITTKNLKDALRSLKSIPILVVLNIIFIVMILYSNSCYRNFRIQPEDTTSVSISLYDDYSEENNYFKYKQKNMTTKDKEAVRQLCALFNNYADIYNQYLNGEIQSFYETYSPDETYSVTFHGEKEYSIAFDVSSEGNQYIKDLIASNENTKDLYTNLPELTDKDFIDLWFFGYLDEDTFSKQKTLTLYECLCEELKTISLSEWISTVQRAYYSYDAYTLDIQKYINGNYYNLILPINECTPKTYQLMIELLSEKHPDDLTLLQSYEKKAEHLSDDASADIILHTTFPDNSFSVKSNYYTAYVQNIYLTTMISDLIEHSTNLNTENQEGYTPVLIQIVHHDSENDSEKYLILSVSNEYLNSIKFLFS